MLFRFRDFDIYKRAQEFRSEVYLVVKKLPKEEKFALADQIRRASISICLNIAEGSNRGSDIEFARFLHYSLGSLEEVVACLDIAQNEGYISNNELNELIKKAEMLGKQLITFKKKLKAQSSKLGANHA